MQVTLKPAIPALLVLLLVACAQNPSTTGGPAGATAQPATATTAQAPAVASTPRSGGVLKVAQAAGDIGTADPDYGSGTQDRALVDMVFNGLVRYKPGDATAFEPDLATALPQATTNADGNWTASNTATWPTSAVASLACAVASLI